MIGYFNVIDKNTNNVLFYYKYSSINDIQKQWLRAKPDVKLVCACNTKGLEVKISTDLRIYPAEQKVGHLHDTRCPKHIHFVPQKLWTIQKTETNIYYHVASHDATAKDFFERINSVTHYRLTHPENRMPDNYKDFIKKAFVTSKYIKTPYGAVLYDISVTNNWNIKEWPVYQEYFIYGEVVAVTKTNFSDTTYYVDIADSYDRRHRYYVEKDVLSTLISIDKYDKGVKYVGGGFVFKKKEASTILSFADFYMTPMNEVGLITNITEK